MDWAARVALASVALYAAVILFEVGYFWRLGGAAMALFSPTEHAVHAIGVVGIVGIVTIAATVLVLYPNVALQLYSRSPQQPAEPYVPSRTRIWIARGSLVASICLIAWSSITILRPLYKAEGFSPVFLICSALAILLGAHMIESGLKQNRRSYVLPGVIVGVLALPALGEAAFQSATSSASATFIEVHDRGRPTPARLIFGGADKLVYQVGGHFFVGDLEGKWQRELILGRPVRL